MDDTYYFHQTPIELAKKLINIIPLVAGDKVLEPFKGEGAFYDHLPEFVEKDWCEIQQGRDYLSYDKPIDWVLTNPPFRLETTTGKKENAFFKLLEFYATRVNKGVAFLGNAVCFGSLTPIRLKKLKEMGFHLQGYTVCNVKKWHGRYYWLVFTKTPNPNIGYIEGSF